MGLHRLLGMEIGVPDPQRLDDFYREIGFLGKEGSWGPDAARDQIRIREAPYRQLTEMNLACHDEEDLARIGGQLGEIGVAHEVRDGRLVVGDPSNHWTVTVEPMPVDDVAPPPARAVNRPGDRPRIGARPGLMTEPTLRPPRRLGHIVIGTNDIIGTHNFYVNGLGYRVSDVVGGLGYFLRCSPDHHNLLIAPGPVPYLNHYAIERDDMDTVMASASRYLEAHEGVQIAGPGRHMIGGNVFWYLRDPSGTFFENFADMDCILDDEAWEIGEWSFDDPNWSLWGETEQPEVFFRPADIDEVIAGYNKAHD